MKTLNTKHLINIISLSIVSIVIIAISLSFIVRSISENNFLKKYNLQDLTITEKISKLDEIIDESIKYRAFVYGDKLIIDGKIFKYNYEIPEDLFYVSIAPYINSTHPCTYHSLMGCRSEMVSTAFLIEVLDNDGKVILSEERTSMENGFIGFWLPKGIEGKIIVTYGELTAESEFTTNSDGITCITTLLQLR